MRHSLDTTISYHLSQHKKIRSLYNDFRRLEGYSDIGDYPLLAIICLEAGYRSVKFSKAEIHQALKYCEDREFTKIPVNSTFVEQLYEINQ